MSKKLKLGVLSTSRILRSGKTLVGASSSEKSSPYFANEEKSTTRTGRKKRTPVKIEYETTENKTDIAIPVRIKNEDAETASIDTNNIKKEEREMRNKNLKQPASIKTENENNEILVEPMDSKDITHEKQWAPPNWEIVLENIREMRKHGTAPVDEMGCDKCVDPNASPAVSRYQSLVALMLSSQTKDQVTHAAMQRLNAYGCKPDIIAATPDDVLGKLIYPVGFWKVSYLSNVFMTTFFLYLFNYLDFNEHKLMSSIYINYAVNYMMCLLTVPHSCILIIHWIIEYRVISKFKC